MSSIENKGKVIYLDNAATTKMSEEVKEAMDPYLSLIHISEPTRP